MRQVAITGGAGFIGANLARRLISEGIQVRVIDDLSTGLITNVDQQRSSFERISITSKSKLQEAIYDCDVIFHFAARGSVPRSIMSPMATNEVNLLGTLNVLEIARKSGAHVIFSSSSSVYGRNLELPKDESMWLGPISPYAASKFAAEGYVQAYASTYGIPVTILRLFNVFGPLQRPDHQYAAVLPKWIWLALHDKPIELFGDGTTTRDFTYVDTVIEVALRAMKSKVTTEGALNVAFGNKISLNEVIELLKMRFPKLKVVHKPFRQGDVLNSQNNPTSINNLFPDIFPASFEFALNETVNWLRGHSQTFVKTNFVET